MFAARERWDGRTAFILAAIGSAIGLGNLWRFPYVCATNGGAAFLIAYVVALFAVGVPILILELSMGHKTQQGVSGSISHVGKQYEWIGWVGICVTFVIAIYYAGVMSWCFNYLVDAFSLAWGDNPSDHFFQETLGLSSGPFIFSGIKPSLLLGLILTWVAIVACLWKGPQTVGKVVYVTVLVPWAILIILVIRGMTLDGASLGLEYYLNPTFSKLLDLSVWRAAFVQVFFSLSVGMSIMFAYGSYLPKKSKIVSDAFIIAICDSLTAFVGGLAVFGALGYLSVKTGTPITELKASGPGLAFVVYPEIINKLPVMREFFGVLFFFMLLTLGIDSAFSLLEAVSCSFRDKFGWSNLKANLILGCCALLLGLIFISGSGLYWLDIIDYFMTNFGLVLAALLECLLFGWIYKAEKVQKHINSLGSMRVGSAWVNMIKYICPAVLAFMLLSETLSRWGSPYEGYPRSAEAVGWLLMFIFIPIVGLLLSRKKA